MNIEERVIYYLGNKHSKISNHRRINPIKVSIFNLPKNNDNYSKEVKYYLTKFYNKFPNYKYKQFLFQFGDVSQSVPFITKSRPIGGRNIILPLNIPRHWAPVFKIKEYDIPFNFKKNKIIWRGAATGKDKRVNLVENYYNIYNVGFTKFLQSYKGNRNSIFIKNKMNLSEMLKYKYLISVEGNDVASNLKWILASNSVCLMPKPINESWLMEGKLIPWIHYVPIKNDFSNLKEIYNWCLQNEENCKQIIKNSQKFIKQFLNNNKEEIIINEILKKC